jgi:hypothetical protein
LDTELRTPGGISLQVVVQPAAFLFGLPEVMLWCWWFEQDDLLIWAVNSGSAVALG